VKSPAQTFLILSCVFCFSSCQDPAPAPPPTVTPAPPPAVTPAVPAATKPPAAAPVKSGTLSSIDVTTLFPRHQAGTVLIFDARPGFVAAFGKIPGSISWPRGDFDARLPQHEPAIRAAAKEGKPVVFYCTDAACPDARAMAERLTARGHDVSVLDGGYAIWKEAGLPTE
jgi:rhodanese-related sulfurtransferase